MSAEYFLGDYLGSTSIVTDASGNKVSETRYKAWGEVRYSSGATPTDYGFTGQMDYTGSFGLLYFNARFYDPSLSRFVSADTIVPPGVQGLDRYGYVNNSPLNFNDPSGHFTCSSDTNSDDYCPGHSPSGGGNGGIPLSNDAEKILGFANKFGITPEQVITAALAGEASGWATDANIMAKKEEAWGNRYQWYVDKFCGGIDTQNCNLNFFAAYSGSVMKMINDNWDASVDKILLITNAIPNRMGTYYISDQTWVAGALLYNAVQSPKPEWISFDPEHNLADKSKNFDVGIIPASGIYFPTLGLGYDQFSYFERVVYEGVDSLSVIMTYCQWQWRVNNTRDGC